MKEALERLGSSADEVAATLRAHGIRGVVGAVRFLNPIVRFAAAHIHVDARSLDVIGGECLRLTLTSRKREEVALPAPVRDFLAAFNRGAYPDLILDPDAG